MFNDQVELEADERKALRALMNSTDTPAPMATRARVVLWRAEGRQKTEIAELAGLSRPTVEIEPPVPTIATRGWVARFTGAPLD